MKLATLTIVCLFAISSYGFVDLKNSNFADSWVDYKTEGTGYQLKVQRTYNSRSTYDGLFGFGWCTDFETRLEIMPDNTLKIIECGGGMEISYVSGKSLTGKDLENHINKIISLSRKVNPRLKKNYIKRLKKDLEDNQYLREALAKKLGIKGKIENGSTFYARGRGGEKLEYKDGVYKRTMSDGTYQKYDGNGRLEALYDRNSNFLKFLYQGTKLVQVVDNEGRRLTFKYAPNDKIKTVIAPGSERAEYTYSGHDLKSVKNAWNMTYSYSYDKLHNLTKIVYPDKTYKEIVYNPDKDLVLSLQDRNKCVEKYEYKGSKDDPRNHYWSTIVKTCNGKVTNRSKYEFWHRQKTDKTGKFLYRVYSDNNGEVTDVKYHDIFGKPISVKEGRKKTYFTYNGLGLVKVKKTALDRISFEYDDFCKKTSKILREEFRDLKNANKTTSKEAVKFIYYKPKCNLKMAINSKGTKVRVGYDQYGRITKLMDQTQKYVSLTYDKKFGKPSVITRPGLGAIKIIYNEQGEMKDFKSSKGNDVARQIASVFNNLLEVVAPATEGLNI